MTSIRKFKVDISSLSKTEKLVLEKLIEAAELIAPLYQYQKNEKYPGANFYPDDVTEEEIEAANRKNPAILDPYTFVERDQSGKLKAIPFHIKFQKELKPVAKLLKEAAELSEDEKFAEYLNIRADSLIDGDYQKSEIIWLTNGSFNSKFGFVIGPIERYLDKLFFKKCAYHAWVGIMDEKRTRKADRFVDVILTSQRKILPKSKKEEVSKLRIRIDRTIMFSGLIANFMFTGTNLPNDVELAKKYGSNLTIFETSLDSKFAEDQLPIFKTLFVKQFQKRYSKDELYEGSLNCILVHEIAHSLIRYRDAEKRLKDLFPVFDEILAYILGIKACGALILKGVLTRKELEAILAMHICRNFTWWLDSLKNPEVNHYAVGAAIATNFFLKTGAIKTKIGISWPDFNRMFASIDRLSRTLEHYLAFSHYDEAKEFVENYGSFKVFERFAPKLKRIKK